MKKLLQDLKIIAVTSHDNTCAAMATIAVPVASYSEYAGCVVNCDNILQRFSKAVTKNDDLADISAIAASLGGPLATPEQRNEALQQVIGALKDLKPDQIPAEGLKLNESEASNATV